jgi:hypothetical protein
MLSDRPLVTNPLSHVLMAAIHNPKSLIPMGKSALKETAAVILAEMGIVLRPPPSSPSSPSNPSNEKDERVTP